MNLDAYRMAQPCDDCPFNADGPGKQLADSLRPGRMEAIKHDLRRGGTFQCHQTTIPNTDDDGRVDNTKTLLCAGAIAYQESVGVTADLIQVIERLKRRNQQGG